MRALEHMKQVLSGTGLYKLTGSSPVEWELAAFGAGFQLLEDRFQKILQDIFVATAGEGQLDQWEALFRDQPSQGAVEERREMVRRRFAVHPDDFTREGVNALLPGAGVQGILLEQSSGLTILLGKLLGVNKVEAQRELDQLLPSHLPWQWDESVTWVAWDAYSRPFVEWDSRNLTWAQLDQATRSDLENNFGIEEV